MDSSNAVSMTILGQSITWKELTGAIMFLLAIGVVIWRAAVLTATTATSLEAANKNTAVIAQTAAEFAKQVNELTIIVKMLNYRVCSLEGKKCIALPR